MEIPVCAHLGLTPQSIRKFGGYKVQGKKPVEQEETIKASRGSCQSRCLYAVLEGIPELLGKEITETVSIPTIGIGAGKIYRWTGFSLSRPAWLTISSPNM